MPPGSLDARGSALAAFTLERDGVRADLKAFMALRDRLGFTKVREIRRWNAPGLLPIARYNGRMYRVIAERK